jgi:hypothetical protein
MLGTTQSDSSWTPYSTVEGAIYSPGSPNDKRAVSTYTDYPLDGYLNIAGKNTRSYGLLVYHGSIRSGSKLIENQCMGTYSSVAGDSGAPIYQQDTTTHEIRLVGLHYAVNTTNQYGVFSPTAAVMSDLGVTPITS